MSDATSADVFTKPQNTGYSELAPRIDAAGLEAFRAVLKSRRSVRVYDGTAIPEAVVRECLDLALMAPNSSNLQATEFHWVRSSEKKQALVEACLGQPAASTAAELFVCVARTGTWRENAKHMVRSFHEAEKHGAKIPPSAWVYYKKLVPLVYTQGPFGVFGPIKKLVLTLAGFFRPTPREPAGNADMRIWAVKSAALACENFMLAFRAHGFDTCPMEGLDSARVRRILGLPRDAVVVMAISAGKRAPNGIYGPQLRFDRKLFIKEV